MSAAPATPSLTPAAAWQLLASGNARFVAGAPRHPHHSRWRRHDLVTGQQPFATILSCSDSRVPPEIAFDRGLGDLFVIRNAGHVLDAATLGSIEYGVGVTRTPLLAVMGHESCGCIAATVAAALAGAVPDGHIGELVRRVMPSVDAASELGASCAGEVMEEHVRQTVRGLFEQSETVAEGVERGELAVVGLTYRLSDGVVSLLDWAGDLGRPHETSAEAIGDAERAILAQHAATDRAIDSATVTAQVAPVPDGSTPSPAEYVVESHGGPAPRD